MSKQYPKSLERKCIQPAPRTNAWRRPRPLRPKGRQRRHNAMPPLVKAFCCQHRWLLRKSEEDAARCGHQPGGEHNLACAPLSRPTSSIAYAGGGTAQGKRRGSDKPNLCVAPNAYDVGAAMLKGPSCPTGGPLVFFRNLVIASTTPSLTRPCLSTTPGAAAPPPRSQCSQA